MFRIVHNEQTDAYRVEKRGWLGWAFVSDPQTGDYLGFADIDEARRWVRRQIRNANPGNRRWQVVADCSF